MKQRAPFSVAAAVVVAGLVANCSGHSTPTGPSVPKVVKLTITPPDAIAPGQSVQFTAAASLVGAAVQATLCV